MSNSRQSGLLASSFFITHPKNFGRIFSQKVEFPTKKKNFLSKKRKFYQKREFFYQKGKFSTKKENFLLQNVAFFLKRFAVKKSYIFSEISYYGTY